MRFIGADLHKKSITFCVVEVVDGATKVIQRRRIACCEIEPIMEFLTAHTPGQLVVETTIGYEWFAELAEPIVDRVVLAHAGKLRVIAESTRKTDKIDAYVLAEFLSRSMIPEAWRPTPRVRQHRSLVRRRYKIQSRITSIKNTMRGMLTRYNSDLKNLFSKTGRQASGKLNLLAEDKWLLTQLWEDLDENKRRLKATDERLAEFASAAGQREQEARAVLETMPQVGPVTIETVLAELGDVRRFHSGDAVVAFAGLSPGVRESDGRRKDLRITKAGSPLLRWILIQLAHRLKVSSARWAQIYAPLEKRCGNKKATCALARRLLLVIYAMLRDGKAYRPARAA